MLTENQLVQFEVFGFVVLRGVLTCDELRIIDSEFDIGLVRAIEAMDRHGIPKQLNWSNLGLDTPFLASLLEDPRFLEATEQLYGQDVVGYYANSNSFDSDRTEWHPDTFNLVRRGVKFAFYLQPLDEKTGALRTAEREQTPEMETPQPLGGAVLGTDDRGQIAKVGRSRTLFLRTMIL